MKKGRERGGGGGGGGWVVRGDENGILIFNIFILKIIYFNVLS